MAAIYRFGFEGENVPSGITFSGSYEYIEGRSGTSSSAIHGSGSLPSYVVAPLPHYVNEIFSTFYISLENINTGAETTIWSFGPTQLTYTPSSTTFKMKSNGVTLASASYNVSTILFNPIAVRSLVDAVTGSFEISIALDATASFVGDTLQGASSSFGDKVIYGLGASSNYPQFKLDDVAINDSASYSNSTGSYGVSDVGLPPYIRALRTFLTSSGPVNQWIKGDTYFPGTIDEIVNGVSSSFIRAYDYGITTKFKFVPLDLFNVTGFEGMNTYYKGIYSQDQSDPAFLNGFLEISGSVTGSVGRGNFFLLSGVPTDVDNTIFEKDFGGKITLSEFNNGYLTIVPTRFPQYNYFGIGGSGNVLYTGSVSLGTSTNDFEFFEFQNLTIASQSFVTAPRKKGLVIYVRENCIIEGTLSMDGKAGSGSLMDPVFIVTKNISSSYSPDSASLSVSSSWTNEHDRQPYAEGTSSLFVIDSYSGFYGSGGDGGNVGVNDGGLGGTPSFYAAGAGGGGAANDAGQNAEPYSGNPGTGSQAGGGTDGGTGGRGGGAIHLIVGGNLVIGAGAKITATGSNGLNAIGSNSAGGGGGGGGGRINIYYGRNIYNFGGTILINGGVGGTQTVSGQPGLPGTSGSYQIVKVLPN